MSILVKSILKRLCSSVFTTDMNLIANINNQQGSVFSAPVDQPPSRKKQTVHCAPIAFAATNQDYFLSEHWAPRYPSTANPATAKKIPNDSILYIVDDASVEKGAFQKNTP